MSFLIQNYRFGDFSGFVDVFCVELCKTLVCLTIDWGKKTGINKLENSAKARFFHINIKHKMDESANKIVDNFSSVFLSPIVKQKLLLNQLFNILDNFDIIFR
jgi:hypothetical protein